MLNAFALMQQLGAKSATSSFYSAKLVQGVQLEIDGNLSDWTGLDVNQEPIARVLDVPAEPTDALAAQFRCIVDSANLYIAIEVTDDQVIYGTEPFPFGGNDDCVEVFFDGDLIDAGKPDFDANDGQIRVVRELDSSVRLEGSAGIFWLSRPRQSDDDIQFPYMWEILGVEAAGKDTETGYAVELRIPVGAIGLEQFSIGTTIGLDFLVPDDDNGGRYDEHLNWASTPRGVSPHRQTQFYGRLNVAEEVRDLDSAAETDVTTTPLPTWRSMFAEDNRSSLREQLETIVSNQQSMESTVFASCVLARLDRKAGNATEEIRRYERLVASETVPNPIKLYALGFLADLHREVGNAEAVNATHAQHEMLSHPESSMILRRRPILGQVPQTVTDVFLSEVTGLTVETWVENLEIPWALVFLPDGDGLVTERPGRIQYIPAGHDRPSLYAELDVAHVGHAGLMGLALHPDFESRPFVYAMHSYYKADKLYNRIVRLRHEGTRGVFDRVIFDEIPGDVTHIGGRIAFGPDGMLYVGTGDVQKPETSQDLEALSGKILRITPEGRIPNDNPFPDSPVYSYGNRVVQGLTWDLETGALFDSEHGPSGEMGLAHRDEINIIDKGGNYGWPEVVGAPGIPVYRDPIVMWKRSSVPPGGMTFYRGDLFVATLGSQALIRIRFNRIGLAYEISRIERWFANDRENGLYGRLRDVTVGPDGDLYVLTSNRDGRASIRPGDDKILRLRFDSAVDYRQNER